MLILDKFVGEKYLCLNALAWRIALYWLWLSNPMFWTCLSSRLFGQDYSFLLTLGWNWITLNNRFLTTQDFKTSTLTIQSGTDSTPRKASKTKLKSIKSEYNCENFCPNIPLIKKYEFHLNELVLENDKLKTINNFFMISMGRKDDYLLTKTLNSSYEE